MRRKPPQILLSTPGFFFGENSHNHIMTNDLQVSGKREKIKKKKERKTQGNDISTKRALSDQEWELYGDVL